MIAFLAIMMISVSGCEKDRGAEKTTIRFVTWKPNQPHVWEEVYSLFREENPDIELVQEVGPHSSTSFHDLLTQKLKNRSRDVDVFFMDVIWPSEFAAAQWAEPLDGFFAADERAKFLQGAVLANMHGGRIFGIPLFVDSGVLYYRSDLLKEYGFSPPSTWDELVHQATVIVEAEHRQGHEITGYSGQFKQYEGLVCDMMEFILGAGGHIIDPQTGRSGLQGQAAREAVRFVRDEIIGKVAPRGVLTYQEPESLDVFIQGRAVFHRNWPYAWEVSNDPQRSRVAGKVGITRLPHFQGGQSHSALGGWQLGISKYSSHKDAAWRFVRFLTSERVQKIFAVRSGKAPTRTALYEDIEVLQANPHFAAMGDVLLTATPRPRTPLYPAVSNVLQRYFSTAISRRDSDIEREAALAAAEVDKILSVAR